MTDRILDFSENATELHFQNSCLVISQEGQPPVAIPASDIGVVLASHPQIRYSQAVLAGLATAGAIFVACDQKHLPIGMLLPLNGNSVQAERFCQQAEVALPVKKRIWRQIVRSKISAQAATLRRMRGEDFGLHLLAAKVRSGDPENIEAHAARRYWAEIFGVGDFRRQRDAEDVNRQLNYGYAVLRAIACRAICSAGLHPGLGFHHHNRYDPFCLADDVMEPFRPIIDEAVARLAKERGMLMPMDKEVKGLLLGALTGRVRVNEEERTLFDALSRCSASLAKICAGEADCLELPVF